MSDRATFKNSIRSLAVVLRKDDDSIAPERPTPATNEPSKQAFKTTEPESPTTPAKPVPRKAKQPAALTWLMPRLKVTKQVSIDIPPELDEMVERASCGQRMDKKFPGYKKEIQSVALVEWLERNGWFRPEKVGGDADDQEDGT